MVLSLWFFSFGSADADEDGYDNKLWEQKKWRRQGGVLGENGNWELGKSEVCMYVPRQAREPEELPAEYCRTDVPTTTTVPPYREQGK